MKTAIQNTTFGKFVRFNAERKGVEDRERNNLEIDSEAKGRCPLENETRATGVISSTFYETNDRCRMLMHDGSQTDRFLLEAISIRSEATG